MSRVIPMSHINAFFTNKKLRPLSLGNTAFLRLKKGALFKKDLSLSISRVLSCTVIYLGLPSPISSSDIHGIPSDGQPYWRIPNLAASGVYMAYCVTTISVSSYLAFPSLPQIGDTLKMYNLKIFLPSNLRRFISVALSRRSPSPDVIRHPVLCCSDFPHNHCWFRDRITNSNL